MQYSPKLKKVMKQLQEIIDDNDLGAVVVIHDKTGFSEYIMKVDPSYSCATLMPNGEGVRFSAKAVDFGGDKKKRDQVVAHTTNMIYHLTECTGKIAYGLINVEEQLSKLVNSNHYGSGHSSNTQQNN